MHSDSAGGAFHSEINVTPLVDVVLVLLIIFMIIVPLTMRGYDIDVPGETVVAASEAPRLEQVVMEIDLKSCPVLEPPGADGLPAGCSVRVNDESVPVTGLAQRIGETFATREPADRVLFLSAHRRLNYEAVMRIVDVARSGADGLRIGLVTDG